MGFDREKSWKILKVIVAWTRGAFLGGFALLFNKEITIRLGPYLVSKEQWERNRYFIENLDADLGLFSGTSGLIFTASCTALLTLVGWLIKKRVGTDRN